MIGLVLSSRYTNIWLCFVMSSGECTIQGDGRRNLETTYDILTFFFKIVIVYAPVLATPSAFLL